MATPNELKAIVKERYAAAVDPGRESASSECCGSSCGCHSSGLSIMADDYSNIPGYVPEADYALGCGLPTEAADIRAGDTVLDLGSGAGNDVFVARQLVGEHGRVIGVDMTPAMIRKAEENRTHLGFTNVEFRLGEIEQLPVANAAIDVVVSNCVLNLVPEKERAFAEMFRVLVPGGRFAVSDIVTFGMLPARLADVAELYAGCVAGAIPRHQYLDFLERAGFRHIRITKQKPITLPESVQLSLLTDEERADIGAGRYGLVSITVSGIKPAPPEAVQVLPAGSEDLDPLRQLLDVNRLPSEDVAEHLSHFRVARLNKRMIGAAGMERHGTDGFLRSFVVEEGFRNSGVGKRLFDDLMAYAHATGIRRLGLMTETAERFFAREGFSVMPHSEAPAFIKSTKEYTTYCPSTSIVMVKTI